MFEIRGRWGENRRSQIHLARARWRSSGTGVGGWEMSKSAKETAEPAGDWTTISSRNYGQFRQSKTCDKLGNQTSLKIEYSSATRGNSIVI